MPGPRQDNSYIQLIHNHTLWHIVALEGFAQVYSPVYFTNTADLVSLTSIPRPNSEKCELLRAPRIISKIKPCLIKIITCLKVAQACDACFCSNWLFLRESAVMRVDDFNEDFEIRMFT